MCTTRCTVLHAQTSSMTVQTGRLPKRALHASVWKSSSTWSERRVACLLVRGGTLKWATWASRECEIRTPSVTAPQSRVRRMHKLRRAKADQARQTMHSPQAALEASSGAWPAVAEVWQPISCRRTRLYYTDRRRTSTARRRFAQASLGGGGTWTGAYHNMAITRSCCCTSVVEIAVCLMRTASVLLLVCSKKPCGRVALYLRVGLPYLLLPSASAFCL